MEQNTPPEKPWYKKTWVIVVGIIVVLIIIGNLGSKQPTAPITTQRYIEGLDEQTKTPQKVATNSTEKNSSSATEQSKEKQWTEVYAFKGNGMKKSPAFELTGDEARLKYKYKSPGSIGMGMFAVYVVDEGKDIMKTGGIPEVMSNAESEESESAIQKGAGRYYLNVNATGNWEVTVEENK